MIPDSIAGFIRSHHRFLITVHTSLDGDALGAQLGFARLLKKLGKRVYCVNDDKVPYGYEFLPGVNAVRRYNREMSLAGYDCMVFLDCSDLRRAGQAAALRHGVPVLNIDHHISNERFGDVNWVVPGACCTCELVYEVFKRMRVAVDRSSALCLYAGILTDTGSFRYSNTHSRTHLIAAELLKTGVRASEVYKRIYGSVPYEDLKLLSRILPTMQTAADGRIVWFQLPKAVLKGRDHLSFDLSESILSFARSVRGVEVALLFRENPLAVHEVRVNFRSQGKADVNKLAAMFGGGGHRTAAGATVRGRTLRDVSAMVLNKVRRHLPR